MCFNLLLKAGPWAWTLGPPALTDDVTMEGQTHTLWWYVHLQGMLLSVENIIPALKTTTNYPSFLCNSHSDQRKSSMNDSVLFLSFGSCNLCHTVNRQCQKRLCVSILFEKEWNTMCFTQLIFRDWVKFGDRSWSVFPWPMLVSDLCDTSWHEHTHTHLQSA